MIGTEIYYKLKEKYGLKSILFCPYKEEMWDSMQTVYEEALKDTEVETCIMPIPYYNLYQLVPVGLTLEFDKVNFPEALNRKWDVIVFHYPYDNQNSITRPLITSGVLKRFCEHLVLISYAITERREVREHEVLLKGVTNSSLVVCENDWQVQEIQKIFDKAGIENTELVAWGSPKYDKRKTEIPAEWEEKRGGRKVIFLQTSVVPYMQNVNKLKEIESFIKRQDSTEFAILWRPHPLYADTIKSLRPYELKVFERIKTEVDIFDETRDYQNAFEFCDLMVSDGSSLDYLFKRTEKPLIRFEKDLTIKV